MSNIELNLEDSISIMERVWNLLMIASEFMDELPPRDNKKDLWKLETFNMRSDMLRALIWSAEDAIYEATKIVKREVLGEIYS